ncbi:AATK [Branchiostoma lanceolatum]|uniref:non-specific serine/threonine protein kinase n=1 Tax=Branchiostoma lanceolatum TaxID=7740 RepID=A0A8K0AFL9_BRALA|nr:AATK [Branchiostoma lanceolatum]
MASGKFLTFYKTFVLFFFFGLCKGTALPHKKDVDPSAGGGLLDRGSVLAAWVSGAVLLSLVVLTVVCLCCKDRRFKDLNEDVTEVSGSSMSPMSDMFAPMSSFTNSPVEIEPLPDITVLSHSGPQSPNPVLAPFGSHPVAARGVRKTNFPRSQLNYVAEIGNGWFGKVLAAEASGLMPGEQKSHVIVRQLKTSAGPEEQAVFLQEMQPNRELQHPNLLVVLAQCLEAMPFLLIMEYCAMGDLKGYLVRQRREAQTLAQKGTLLRMACDMSAGLHFMHQNGFTHGDLALRNCMVGSDLTVKIGDYGLSHERYKGDYALVNQTELVPVRWMAPETVRLSGGQVRLLDTSTQANVWSFGVCLWELLELGRQPYSGLSDQDVLVEVITEQTVRLPQPVLDILHADRWYELMQFCWLSAEERPSMGELYSLLSYLRHQKEELDAAEFERKWTTMKPRDTVASLNDSKLALNGSAVSSSPDLVMSHLRGSSHSLNVSVTSQDSRLSGSVASGVVPVDVIVHWPRRSSATSSIVSTGTLTGSDTERTNSQDANKASRTESTTSDNVFASVPVTEPDASGSAETSVKPDVTLTDTGTSEVGNSNVSANNSNSAGPALLLPSLLRTTQQQEQHRTQQQHVQQQQQQMQQYQQQQEQHEIRQGQQQEQQRSSQQQQHEQQQQQVLQQYHHQEQQVLQEVRRGQQQQLSQEQHKVTVSKGQQLLTHEQRVSESQKFQSSSTVDSTVVQETSTFATLTSSNFSFRSEMHKSATSNEVKVHEEKGTEGLNYRESTLLVSPSSSGLMQAAEYSVTESVQHTSSENTVEQKKEHSTESKTFQFSDSVGTSLVRSTLQETVSGIGSFQRTSTPTLEVEASVHTPSESPVKSEASSDANVEESSESATGSYATPDTSMGQVTLEDSSVPAVVKEDQSVESQLFLSAADFSQTVPEEKNDDILAENQLSDVLSHPVEDREVVRSQTDNESDKICSNGHCDHDSNNAIAKQEEKMENNTENSLAFDSLSPKEVVRTFDSAEDKSEGFYRSALGQQAIDDEAMFVGKTEHNRDVTASDVIVEKSTDHESTIEEQDTTVGLSFNITDGSLGSLESSVHKEANLPQDSETYAFTGTGAKDASDVVDVSKESFDDKSSNFWNTDGRENISNSDFSFDVELKAHKDVVEDNDERLDFSAASLGQDIFGNSFVPASAKPPRDEDSVSSSVQGDSGADITGDWASSDEEEESSAAPVINPDKQILSSDIVSGSERSDVAVIGSSFHDSAAQYSPKGSPKFSPPKDELELYRERKASLSESQGSEDDTTSPAASEVKTVVTNDFSDDTESPDSAMLVSPYAEEDARDIEEDSLEEQAPADDSSHLEDVPAIVVTMDPATTGPVLLLDDLDGPRESTDHPDSMAQDQPDRFAGSDVIRLTESTDLDESTTDDLPESDTRDSALASSIQSTPLTPSPTTTLPPQPQKSALKRPGSVIDKSRRVCFLGEGSSVHVEVFNYTKEPDEDLEHIVLIRDSDGSSTSETSDSEMDEDSSLQGEYDWGSEDEEEEEYDLEWDDGMTKVVQDMNSMTSGTPSPSFTFTQAAISSNYVGSSAAYIPRTTMFSAAVDGQMESHVVERLESSPLPSPSWSPSRFSVQPASFSMEQNRAVEDIRDDSDSLEVILSDDERPVTSA